MEAESPAKDLKKIQIGMKVLIQKKRLETTREGIVTWINDTEQFNENGIEVDIDDYFPGNVKKIIKSDEEIISKEELIEKIQKHENSTFEMKAGFKYDLDVSERLGKPTASEKIKRKIIEEAAGFLNTDGGMLCLGVDNEKNIIGLEHEFKLQSDYSPEKDRSLCIDKLRGEIVQAFKDYFDDNVILDPSICRIVFVDFEEKVVCCIKLEKAPHPVFVKIHGSFKDDKLKKDVQGGETVWKCWIRLDGGLLNPDFDEFMKMWKKCE